jgi:uncharacterized protein (DUF1778 family)
MPREKSEVISFRVPADIAVLIDRRAAREKKHRSDYVKDAFLPIFLKEIENLANGTKAPDKQPT